MAVLPNISINLSGIAVNQPDVCELNQIAMMNSIAKMPLMLLLFIGLAVLGLIVYLFVIPAFNFKHRKTYLSLRSNVILFVFGCLLWACLYDVALTFSLSEQDYLYLTYFFIVVIVLVGVYYLIVNWDKIKSFRIGKIVDESESVNEKEEICLSPSTYIISIPSPGVVADSPSNKNVIPEQRDQMFFSYRKNLEEDKMEEKKESIIGFCMRCRQKREMVSSVIVSKDSTRGVKRFYRGTCPTCKTTMIRMIGK